MEDLETKVGGRAMLAVNRLDMTSYIAGVMHGYQAATMQFVDQLMQSYARSILQMANGYQGGMPQHSYLAPFRPQYGGLEHKADDYIGQPKRAYTGQRSQGLRYAGKPATPKLSYGGKDAYDQKKAPADSYSKAA